MVLIEPGYPLPGPRIVWIEREHLRQTTPLLRRVLYHRSKPQPGLLIALVCFDELHQCLAGRVAPPGPGRGYPLLQQLLSVHILIKDPQKFP
jgi:hypothetical protein